MSWSSYGIRSRLRCARVGWGGILDPGLPYARGLWAVEHREGKRPYSAWITQSGALAQGLNFASASTGRLRQSTTPGNRAQASRSRSPRLPGLRVLEAPLRAAVHSAVHDS